MNLAGLPTRPVALLVAALALPALSGCETMQEHSVATGAVGGGALGALAGSLIDKDNPGRGALIGAAAGAALGAGAGYLAKKHFDNVKSRQSTERKLGQASANADYEKRTQQAIPAVTRVENLAGESRVSPSSQLRPGQDADFTLAFQAVGPTPYGGSLCREDILSIQEEGTYAPIKNFGQRCDLPVEGRNEHTISFPIPEGAPGGQYLLTSRVYDPAKPGSIFEQDFHFNVIGATASAPAGDSGVAMAAR